MKPGSVLNHRALPPLLRNEITHPGKSKRPELREYCDHSYQRVKQKQKQNPLQKYTDGKEHF